MKRLLLTASAIAALGIGSLIASAPAQALELGLSVGDEPATVQEVNWGGRGFHHGFGFGRGFGFGGYPFFGGGYGFGYPYAVPYAVPAYGFGGGCGGGFGYGGYGYGPCGGY